MALEKRWLAVPEQTTTLQGEDCGVLQVENANLFRVKQIVRLNDGTSIRLFQVKRVNSANELELGGVATGINDRSDLTSFPPGSLLSADEQERTRIAVDDTQRAVYEEDPVVALRTIAVDRNGDIVDATQSEFSIQTPDGNMPLTGDACADGTNPLHVSVQNDAFTLPYNKMTVTRRRHCGQPEEISTFKSGIAQEIMTIQYFPDGEFMDFEVVTAPVVP